MLEIWKAGLSLVCLYKAITTAYKIKYNDLEAFIWLGAIFLICKFEYIWAYWK